MSELGVKNQYIFLTTNHDITVTMYQPLLSPLLFWIHEFTVCEIPSFTGLVSNKRGKNPPNYYFTWNYFPCVLNFFSPSSFMSTRSMTATDQ